MTSKTLQPQSNMRESLPEGTPSSFTGMEGNYTRGKRQDVEDVYIAVMGVTGAGKSSFIKLITSQQHIQVGHGMRSCTQKVEVFSFMHNEVLRVHLVDTPGFDDTERKDSEVLRDVAGWLTGTYENRIRLSCIIYFHRITDTRMQGSAKRNLVMFQKLCGRHCLENIILATTFWDIVDPDAGARREQELIDTEEFWGYMHKHGSTVLRHCNTQKSAMDILTEVLQIRCKVTLEIQNEMNIKRLELDKTQAGRQLNEDILKEREKHKQEMQEVQEQLQQVHDKELAKQLADIRNDLQEKINQGVRAKERLQTDLETLQAERDAEIQRIHDQLKRQSEVMEKKCKDDEEREAYVKSMEMKLERGLKGAEQAGVFKVIAPALVTGAVSSYLKMMARFGIPLEMYMESGTRMLEIAFRFKDQSIALHLATVAVNVLRGILEQKGNGPRNKATARAVSKIFVRGLNRAVKNGFTRQVVNLLDDRTKLFGEAIRKKDKRNADSLSEIGMILLMVAIEEGPTEEAEIRGHWSITEYLSKSWVIELDRAKPTEHGLVQELVNSRIDEFNDFTKTGELEYGRTMVKGVVETLQAASEEKKLDISKMISRSVVKALDRAIGEGHQNEVQIALDEAAEAIYRGIKKSEDKKAAAISEAGHDMLVAAIEINAKTLVKILSKSWLTKLDRAMQDGHSEPVQRLIEVKARTLCDGEVTWEAAIEMLLAAMAIKGDLVRAISKSWLEALEGGCQDKVGSLIKGNTNGEEKYSALIELLLAAIREGKEKVAQCLSQCWADALANEIKKHRNKVAAVEIAMELVRRFHKALEEGEEEAVERVSAAARKILKAGQKNAAVEELLTDQWKNLLSEGDAT